MSQYDSEIEQIEHELTVLGRQSIGLASRLVALRQARGRAFKEEMRLLSISEDKGFNFALQSIMGEEGKFRCSVCGRLLVGRELHGNTCFSCRAEDKA